MGAADEAFSSLFGGTDEAATKTGKVKNAGSTAYNEGPAGLASKGKQKAATKASGTKQYAAETVDEASTLAGLGISSAGSFLATLLGGPTGWAVLALAAYLVLR